MVQKIESENWIIPTSRKMQQWFEKGWFYWFITSPKAWQYALVAQPYQFHVIQAATAKKKIFFHSFILANCHVWTAVQMTESIVFIWILVHAILICLHLNVEKSFGLNLTVA